jgi:hypothetical protein
MLIGIKTNDKDNFSRVADYIIKNIHGTRAHIYKDTFTYYKVNMIECSDLRVLYYYITQGIVENIKIVKDDC